MQAENGVGLLLADADDAALALEGAGRGALAPKQVLVTPRRGVNKSPAFVIRVRTKVVRFGAASREVLS